VSDEPDGPRWLRRHEVAEIWGVGLTTVAAVAARYGVQTKTITTERRYLAEDVERAHREMLGGDEPV
jgi:hypothetical protein